MELGDVFVHERALVESSNIGVGSRIWAFAHVLPGAVIGRDANICDHVFIENDVFLGDRVTIKCGVQLWDGLRVGDDVFIGPNATFTNDLFPRSKQYPQRFEKTIIENGASIGANATILAGVTIGTGAMIGAGAVVTRDVPPYAVAVGNPARVKRYVVTAKEHSYQPAGDMPSVLPSIDGVQLLTLPQILDPRGALSFGEVGQHLPFVPQRYFIIYQVPPYEVRGGHAHKVCKQLLICVHGKCSVVLDDSEVRNEFELNDPYHAILIPPMVWGTQYHYTDDAVLLVLASHIYDGNDYIRDYKSFCKLKKDEYS
ncbi:MAG: WxcM-like domain-containing protein [bacterium]